MVIESSLLISGNHVPLEAGDNERRQTVDALASRAAIPVSGIVPMPLGSGSAVDVAQAMSAVTAGMAIAFSEKRPDLLLVLGDRYEMHAVVVAASALRIPIAHIHGGEESEGALDNLYRHSITKLSHLHFCATELSRRRILAMGEEPWRVHVTGAPALDGLSDLRLIDRHTLLASLDLEDGPFAMATFHPETIDIGSTMAAFNALITALDDRQLTTIFSRANADESGQTINDRLDELAQTKPWLKVRDNLGRHRYFSAMKYATFMVGNSSSGIIEAASFGLPVVNVGQRQAGRERSPNTLDSPATPLEISKAIAFAETAAFRAQAQAAGNTYFRPGSAQSIRRGLEGVTLDSSLLIKRFAMEPYC